MSSDTLDRFAQLEARVAQLENSHNNEHPADQRFGSYKPLVPSVNPDHWPATISNK